MATVVDSDIRESENLLEEIMQGKYSSSEFIYDARVLAKHYIDILFSKKTMHCGGKIPPRILYDSQRISDVLNLNFLDALDMIYSATEKMIEPAEVESAKRIGRATWDVVLLNETLRLMANLGIPQEFSGGLLLMYFELCEGVVIER